MNSGGVEFLHQRKIYHTDIKPENILLTPDDNIRICDFGIAVGKSWQTKSSATTSLINGNFHCMSSERLNNALRIATNDTCIWSLRATFVEIICGQPINHEETFPQIVLNILQYKIFINGKPYNEVLQALGDGDDKRKIITRTLCKESNRANCEQLLSLSVGVYTRMPSIFARRIPKQMLIRAGENHPYINGLSYNLVRDELFLADYENRVVRAMRVRDNAGDLRDVYKGNCTRHVTIRLQCVPHERLRHTYGPDRKFANWLVALRHKGSECGARRRACSPTEESSVAR